MSKKTMWSVFMALLLIFIAGRGYARDPLVIVEDDFTHPAGPLTAMDGWRGGGTYDGTTYCQIPQITTFQDYIDLAGWTLQPGVSYALMFVFVPNADGNMAVGCAGNFSWNWLDTRPVRDSRVFKLNNGKLYFSDTPWDAVNDIDLHQNYQGGTPQGLMIKVDGTGQATLWYQNGGVKDVADSGWIEVTPPSDPQGLLSIPAVRTTGDYLIGVNSIDPGSNPFLIDYIGVIATDWGDTPPPPVHPPNILPTAQSQIERWDNLAIYGGTILYNDFAVDPADQDHLFMIGGTPAYLYESKDGGATWLHVPGLGFDGYITQCLFFDPGNPETLYAETYVSHDRGATWRHLDGIPGEMQAVDPQDSHTLYVGDIISGRLFRSTDGGGHWLTVPAPEVAHPYFLRVAIDPSDSQVIYAVVHNDGSDRLFKSADGGGHWTAKPISLDTTLNDWRQNVFLLIDPSNPQRLVISNFYGIYLSENGGDSWSLKYTAQNYVTAMARNPANPDVLVAFDLKMDNDPNSMPYNNYVVMSTDGGSTWQFQSSNNPPLSEMVYAACIRPDGRILTGMRNDGGIAISDDRGASWRRSNTGIQGVQLASIDVDPRDSGIIQVAIMGQGVMRSTDGGTSWTVASDTRYGALVVKRDPMNIDTLYTAYNVIQRSQDNGKTWSLYYDLRALSVGVIEGLYLSPVNSGTVVAGGLTNMFARTSDDGFHFDQVGALGGNVFCMDYGLVEGQPVVYALISTDVLKSTDEGESWTPLGLNVNANWHELAVDHQNGNILYVADPNTRRLRRSDDGGATWQDVSPRNRLGGPFAASCEDIELDSRDSNHLFFTTSSAEVFESTDGGGTWSKLAGNLSNLGEIAYVPPQASMGGVRLASVNLETRSRGQLLLGANGGLVRAILNPQPTVNAVRGRDWMVYE